MKNSHTNRDNKIGRPTVLTPALINQVASLLRSGCLIETAAAAVGITRETLYAWLRKAAKLEILRQTEFSAERPFELTGEDALLIDFSDTYKKALAIAELQNVATIKRASRKYWQAAAWLLERRYPQRWGRRIRAEITALDDEATQSEANEFDMKKLTLEQLAQFMALLKIIRGEDTAENGNENQPTDPC
jgi:transposase